LPDPADEAPASFRLIDFKLLSSMMTPVPASEPASHSRRL
jgi:hypothetical protein